MASFDILKKDDERSERLTQRRIFNTYIISTGRIFKF